MIARVQGGTGARSKNPLRPARKSPWVCRHGHVNPKYATRCLGEHCPARRPEEG